MLKTTDFELIVGLIERGPYQDNHPHKYLNNLLAVEAGGLFFAEIWRLKQSIHLAALCGDISDSVSRTFSCVCDAISCGKVFDFENKQVWKSAIAKVQNSKALQTNRLGVRDRTKQVAKAVIKLRQSKRKLIINAYGIEWDQRSLFGACQEVESLARLLGGQAILGQLFEFLKAADRIHDEIWLCGEMNLGLHQNKQASLPIGWLVALASKYSHVACNARNPAVAWRSLVEKTTDIAASFDAERYSQFEEIDIAPTELWRSLGNSVVWQELFSVAQTPSLTIEPIVQALDDLLDQDNDKDFKSWSLNLWNEYARLKQSVSRDKTLHVPEHVAKANFPMLVSSSFSEQCNANWTKPLGSTPRDDSQFVFLRGPEKCQLFVRPISITNTAFLETMFRQLWSDLPKERAKQVVGKLLENVISNACESKTENPYPDFKYQVGKDKFQIDFASFDDTKISLIEVKSKSLTRQARGGNVNDFLADFSNSFLKMLIQLTRHERHFRGDQIQLAGQNAVSLKTDIEKIAVSPLSFGPVSDKLTMGAIVRSMANFRLNSAGKHRNQIATFNKSLDGFFSELMKFPRDPDDAIDLHQFFLFTHWMDVGQLLYVLDKSSSLENALKPIRHLTFASRDFWTEIAWAEKQGLTDKYWS